MTDRLHAARVGVLGSLCNPPHVGHLLLASEAAWQLGLDRVVLVPTGMPAHRDAPDVAPDLRHRMAVAAATVEPLLTVSRVELDRPGPSYMSDTLRELAQRYPGCELVLVIGADQLAALPRWHEAERLPELARIAVAERPGIVVPGLDRARVEHVRMPLVDVASSDIRERVALGQPIRHLVPDPVAAVIVAEGLYRRPAGGARPQPW